MPPTVLYSPMTPRSTRLRPAKQQRNQPVHLLQQPALSDDRVVLSFAAATARPITCSCVSRGRSTCRQGSWCEPVGQSRPSHRERLRLAFAEAHERRLMS